MSDDAGAGSAPGGSDHSDAQQSQEPYGQGPSSSRQEGNWQPTQNPSGQPTYGPGQDGQQPDGQPPHGQERYGQQQYGQQQYGQGRYGHGQDSQPSHGQQQYGDGQYSAPGQSGTPQYQGPPGQGGPSYTDSGQQSWQQIAPEHVARMYQPGVIPLRPLKLGDIFGGAINTIRRNPEATIGMAVIVLGAFLVPSLLISFGLTWIPGLNEDISLGLATVVPSVLSLFPTLVLSGLILYVVSEAALGDKVGLGQTWRAVRGRIWPLIGVTLLTTLITIAVVVVGVSLLIASIATGETVLIVLGVGLLLASFILAVWLGVRLILASAPVVLEGAGPLRALRRSWALSTGSQFWRLLGITILANILVGIISTVLATPLQLLVAFGAAIVVQSEAQLVLVAVFTQHLSQFLVGLIVTPFSAGVTALLYLDQRIRREALDITMQQAATQRTAERSRP